MSPLEMVGLPLVNLPLSVLLPHVIPEHGRDIANFFRQGAEYTPTFTIIHRYREPSSTESPYVELKFFWKRIDGVSGNNTYYFRSSICQALVPIGEPKGKLESFIQRKKS